MLTLRHHVDARDEPGHDDQLKRLFLTIAQSSPRAIVSIDPVAIVGTVGRDRRAVNRLLGTGR